MAEAKWNGCKGIAQDLSHVHFIFQSDAQESTHKVSFHLQLDYFAISSTFFIFGSIADKRINFYPCDSFFKAIRTFDALVYEFVSRFVSN